MTEYIKFNNDLKIERTETFEDGTATFEGFFIVYDSPAPYGNGETQEQISREAVTRSLETNDIRCLFNHNHDIVLGRTGNGTLTLIDKEEGLYGICKVNPKDSDAMNAYERVKRGDIAGCSFGAYIDWDNQDYNVEQRLVTVKDLDLIEVSVCSFPFYPQTTMSARSVDKAFEKLENEQRAKELKLKYLKKKGEKRWH